MQSIIYTNLKNEEVGGAQDQWGKAFSQWVIERYVPTVSLEERVQLANKKSQWKQLLENNPETKLQDEPDFVALWRLFVNDSNVKVVM